MNKLLIVLVLAISLLSCEAIKNSICPTKEIPVYHHFYDTVQVKDTVAFVAIERRDTIPIFKGTKIFFGSSYDSVSKKDSMRYFSFEIMNYGGLPYIFEPNKHLKILTDLEINSLLVHSDTLLIQSIPDGYSREYNLKYPARWFKQGVPYHYRLSIVDQDFKIVDVFYPRPLNEKMPEKKYDEVTGDTIIYWKKPTLVIRDTVINIKRVGYAYKDSLLFIDDIIGCRIYSHYFNGNKFYSFTVDTCLKLLCNKEITDNNTESVSAIVIKAYSAVPGATMQIYVNDTLSDQFSYSSSDSLFVGLLVKPFTSIRSVRLASESKWTILRAKVNNYNLLTEPAVVLKNVTKVGSSYEFNPTINIKPIAAWLFNGNGKDEMGSYPITVSNAAMYRSTNSPIEGTHYLDADGSTYTATAPAVPLGDEFSISLWYRNWNQTNGLPIMGNSKVYSPDGFVLYLDGADNKQYKFVTSDGTANNRKYIVSIDGAWTRGTWNHILVTGSRTNAALGKMYVNGVDKTGTTYTTGTFQTFRANLPIYIGRSSDNPGWCGIDNVKIYDRVLNASEVMKVYNGESLSGNEASISFIMR